MNTAQRFVGLFLAISSAHSATRLITEEIGFLLAKSSPPKTYVRAFHPVSKRFYSSSIAGATEKIDQAFSDKKTVRILSIEGGGIRGLIPLRILFHLEGRVNRPIAHQFDVITGASTGGIISLGLNLRKEKEGINPVYDTTALIKMYVEECRKIFDFRKVENIEVNDQGRHEAYKKFLDLLTPENRERYCISLQNLYQFLQNPPFGTAKTVRGILDAIGMDRERALGYIEEIRKILTLKDMDPILTDISGRRNILESTHSERGLKTLRDKFGESKLSESLSTVLIPAYDIGSARPHLFNSYLAQKSSRAENPNFRSIDDYKMGDIAMATAAAPTYFPPVEITHCGGYSTNHNVFVDGSIVANNPSLYALITAQGLFPDATEFLIVSLGCGTGKDMTITKQRLKDYGLVGWGPHIIPTLMEASNQYTTRLLTVADRAEDIQKRVRFVHLSPTGLSDNVATNMDLTGKEDIDEINRAAERYVREGAADAIERLVTELKEYEKRPYATGLGGVYIGSIQRFKGF